MSERAGSLDEPAPKMLTEADATSMSGVCSWPAQVRTIADFRMLDDGEILEGYLDGFQGEPAPDCTCSRSYWHGWRNGMVDSSRCLPDQAYLMLARAFADRVV